MQFIRHYDSLVDIPQEKAEYLMVFFEMIVKINKNERDFRIGSSSWV